MQLSKILAAMAAALPAVAMSASLTNSNIDTRTTTNLLSFSDLAFDNVSKLRTDTLRFHGSVGDAGKFTIDGPFGPTVVVSVVAGAGMSVANETLDPTGSVSYRAAITGTANQSITQSWTVHTSPSLSVGVSGNGLHTLEFVGANNGFLKSGGVFDYAVTLPGNWSTQGTATGDFELLGLNPEFSITKDFTFDPASNTTTLEVLDTHYDLKHPNVGLDFVVFGSPVSEPLTPALLLSGLGALGWMRRRRQAR